MIGASPPNRRRETWRRVRFDRRALTELPFAAPLWPRVRPWLTVALALVVMACAVELEPRPALVLITLACVRSVAEAAREVRRRAAA